MLHNKHPLNISTLKQGLSLTGSEPSEAEGSRQMAQQFQSTCTSQRERDGCVGLQGFFHKAALITFT